MIRFVALSILVFTLGCHTSEPESGPTASQRMTEIIALAQHKATDPEHSKLLSQGTVFVNLEGLDMPCVGVAVPNPNTSNRILVSFTQEWFDTHSNDEVANAIVADLEKVLADSELSE